MKTIKEKDADYIPAVKENQPGLLDQVRKLFKISTYVARYKSVTQIMEELKLENVQ